MYVLSVLWCAVGVNVAATSVPTAVPTPAPLPVCESSLLSNPSFETLKDPSSTNFFDGNVVGWAASHGIPLLFGGFHGAYSARMWGESGGGAGIVTNVSFTSGVQYRVTMWVQTQYENPNGTIYVRIANGVPDGTTTLSALPSVSSAQTVYTNYMFFGAAQEITFDFTANANYAQMWFYPLLTAPATNGQDEFRIDNVRVCEVTTAATIAPPTPVPTTLGAPLPVCESSLLSNPSFETLKDPSSTNFFDGNVVGWAASHGIPLLFGGFHGAYSARMWGESGGGAGIVTNVSFTSGVQYRVTMWVQTQYENPNGTIYVRIANGVPDGTTTLSALPSVSSAQTVYTNYMFFGAAQEITFDFTANANYAQMWFYPLLTAPATNGQDEFRIDNVRVCVTTAATIAPPTPVPTTLGAPLPVCESSLLSNPSFETLKDPSSTNFFDGNVVGWAASHGIPLLFGGFHGAYSARMWGESGGGAGIVTNVSFTSGVQYRVTMWVQTQYENPNGTIYVRIANGVPDGTTTLSALPSVSSAQTVYTNYMFFGAAQEITFDFTANANYAQMWFYPLLTAPATNGQDEFRIDNVRVCEVTTAATIAPPTPVPTTLGAPLPVCESSLLSNPSFETLKDPSSTNFFDGNVVGWAASHGIPLLFGGFHGAYSARMWGESGGGAGIVTNVSFTSGVQYRVTMWVQTQYENPNGTIYVRIANGVPDGTTTLSALPSVSSAQTVYTNYMFFGAAQEITFDFTANANYAQMWFYPLLTAPATNGQDEFRIDNVRVCEVTTDATITPPTPVPATLAPATTAPETGAPVDVCESSLLTNPSFERENGSYFGDFYGGNVVGWGASHGTPSLFGGYHGKNSAYMWSLGGKSEGIVTNVSFTSGVQYRVTMWVQTKNPDGTIYVRIANGVPVITTWYAPESSVTPQFALPSVSSVQTVYTNTLVFTTAQEITFDFTANANYAQMWFYPYLSSLNGQAEFHIDNVRVCEMITAAPLTPVPAPTTDTPDTSAPRTTAPETSTPETEAPETKAPETKAPETKAPETEAPETSTPETEAPETKAPETEAPETEAPETSTPETEAPETKAPETEAPTPETSTTSVPTTNAPLTVEDVDWCDVDADCRTYDDSAATCVESKCVCTESEGFVNPVTKKTKETLFICVQPTKRGQVKLRLEWNVDCEQSNGAIEGAVRTAIEETTKGRTDTLVVSCGSTIFVVDVEDADITTAATEDMSELIVTSLKKNEAAVAAGFATPMTVGSSLVPTLKCSAAGATEMVLVNGGCVALACESGYLLSSGSCVEDDDSDDTLSTGAIVGIVLGCTAFVVMIIAVAAFFLCKGSKAEDTVCHPPHHTSTHCRPQLSSQKPNEPACENEGTVNGAV